VKEYLSHWTSSVHHVLKPHQINHTSNPLVQHQINQSCVWADVEARLRVVVITVALGPLLRLILAPPLLISENNFPQGLLGSNVIIYMHLFFLEKLLNMHVWIWNCLPCQTLGDNVNRIIKNRKIQFCKYQNKMKGVDKYVSYPTQLILFVPSSNLWEKMIYLYLHRLNLFKSSWAHPWYVKVRMLYLMLVIYE